MLLRLQNTILELIARGEPLPRTAEVLCAEAEKLAPDAVCSVLTVDAAGLLHPLAAPNLPIHFSQALDGLRIGPAVGSCGTAAYRSEPVSVADIAEDPLWADYRDLVLPLGFIACWSSPINDRTGKVVGTFAFYYRTSRGPSQVEREIVETCVKLCAIAMERDRVQAENHRLAYFDTLTGIGNRASFRLLLDSARAIQPGSFALMLIDIDRLKGINDTFGHLTGDDLIRTISSRMKREAAPNRCFRLGGDELAVVLEEPNVAQSVDATAAKLLAAMREPVTCGGHTILPSITIGAAILDDRACNMETLRQNADFALYHAKETARGGFMRYSAGLRTTISKRGDIVRAVGDALDDCRIEAHYQPIVRLDTAEIVGLEALCRMRDLDGTIIPAGDFQQAMEDAEIACRVTDRMLTSVAGHVRAWLDLGLELQHVGVNVATADFTRGDLEDRISRPFKRFDVPLKHIILEVTETVHMGDGDDRTVAQAVEALRAKGLLVALDDFGTGYASLTHLLSFPVDVLKIDRSFVERLAPNNGSAIIIEGLIDIARKLGVRVVAEGIETRRQAEQLKQLGCILGQGYLFARAADFEVTTERLIRLAQRRAAPETAAAIHPPKRSAA